MNEEDLNTTEFERTSHMEERQISVEKLVTIEWHLACRAWTVAFAVLPELEPIRFGSTQDTGGVSAKQQRRTEGERGRTDAAVTLCQLFVHSPVIKCSVRCEVRTPLHQGFHLVVSQMQPLVQACFHSNTSADNMSHFTFKQQKTVVKLTPEYGTSCQEVALTTASIFVWLFVIWCSPGANPPWILMTTAHQINNNLHNVLLRQF